MQTQYIDLVTDDGQIVRVECPAKHYDACHDSLTNAMKNRDWWSPNRFEGCKCELNGNLMGHIAMWKIIGML